MTTALVVGVGNTDRGDDGIGPAVVDALHARDPSLDVLVREGDLSDLPLSWDGHDVVVIVDACSTGRPPGTLSILDPESLRRAVPVSTHGVGVAEALRLARHLGRLPPRLTVVGVEGLSFSHGPLSAELEDAVPEIAARLHDLVRQQCARPRPAPSSGT